MTKTIPFRPKTNPIQPTRHYPNGKTESPRQTQVPYVAVTGNIVRETEKAYLMMKGKQQVWLPKSITHHENIKDTSGRDVVDVPNWLASKSQLATSYNPVTTEGKKRNADIGFENYLTVETKANATREQKL